MIGQWKHWIQITSRLNSLECSDNCCFRYLWFRRISFSVWSSPLLALVLTSLVKTRLRYIVTMATPRTALSKKWIYILPYICSLRLLVSGRAQGKYVTPALNSRWKRQQGALCTIRSHGTELITLGRKLQSGTFRKKDLVPVQPDFPLWIAQRAHCSYFLLELKAGVTY